MSNKDIHIYELQGMIMYKGKPIPATSLLVLSCLQLAKQNNLTFTASKLLEVTNKILTLLAEEFELAIIDPREDLN